RRAITERLRADDALERRARTVEVTRLVLRGLGTIVKVAMMPDFMAGGGDFPQRARKGICRMAWYEPGRGKAPLLQHREDALRAHVAELTARNRARRARVKGPYPHRHRIEVEGEANGDFFRHRALPCRGIDSSLRDARFVLPSRDRCPAGRARRRCTQARPRE